MILPLLEAGHPGLQERARPVQGEPTSLIADLWETLHAKKGLGLAAPQVGIPVRVAVVLVNGFSRVLINPVVLWQSLTRATEVEGCLSLPGVGVPVSRPVAIMLEGEPVPFEGLIARVVQHEIDHMNGILITDPERSA